MWDVIIVGGGPAGATVASILLKHRPNTKVLVLERARFPRFHVGETLVPEVNRVLHEIGAYDKIDQAGFVRKWGATFSWGRNPEPWHMIFGELSAFEALEVAAGEVQTAYTWHVRRNEYDRILLDHAAELGAEVRQDEGVKRMLREGERVVGVQTDDGQELRARWVVDATGQQGLEGSLTDRQLDPRLRNVACFGYYRNWKLQPQWNGRMDNSRAFIVAHPHGWCWVFPVSDDLLSVGAVSTLAHYKELDCRTPEALLELAIRDSAELTAILGEATLVPLEDGMPLAHRMADFSYVSNQIVQPGMARAGDAAGFVDPILSVGCFLGQTLSRILAYALLTCLKDPWADEARLMGAYADHVRDTLGAYRELAYFFYRFNARADDWWAEARRLVADAGLSHAADDEEAFLAFATGFAARRSVFREPTTQFDEPFFIDAFRRFIREDAFEDVGASELADGDVLRLRGAVDARPSAVPEELQGRMTSSIRVEVRIEGSEDAAQTRRMHVPPSIASLFDLLDGERTVAEVAEALADASRVRPDQRPKLVGYARAVMTGLLERGLVEVAGRDALSA